MLNKTIIFSLLLFLGSSINTFSQNKQYDVLPKFGKDTSIDFPKYVFSKIDQNKYPQKGTIFLDVQFDNKGKIIDVKTKRGLDKILDEEVKRVLLEMPRWNPAKLNKKAVSVTIVVPIAFK